MHERKNAQERLRACLSIRAFLHSCIRAFRVLADSVLSVVLSPSCAACRELLEHPTRGPVCDACWRSILVLTPPLCDQCGDPLPAWRELSVPLARCPRCRRGRHTVDRGRAIGAYEGALRAIVQALKYEGRRSLARPLAGLMRVRGAEMLAGADCVVPVPLHASRRRQRGFNQAADLARHLGLPCWGVLRRERSTLTQAGLPAAQRHRNVRGAFALAKGLERREGLVGRQGQVGLEGQVGLKGLVVVLIDDVATTGATLDACARVLKDAGVREVRALTAARVVTRRH